MVVAAVAEAKAEGGGREASARRRCGQVRWGGRGLRGTGRGLWGVVGGGEEDIG